MPGARTRHDRKHSVNDGRSFADERIARDRDRGERFDGSDAGTPSPTGATPSVQVTKTVDNDWGMGYCSDRANAVYASRSLPDLAYAMRA
jgi:hypothetical protein